MNVGLAIGTLGLLGLLACAGASGSATVSGTDPGSIRNAPAGAALTIFIDLETLRPDQLIDSGASLTPGISLSFKGGSATYTFNTRAANGGALTGTVTVSGPVPGAGALRTYTEVFDLTATTALAGGATQTWTYTGSQLVTVNGSSAKISPAATAIRADFADSAAPAGNQSYAFTPNLALDLADRARVALSGNYQLAGSNDITITCSVASGAPILWTPACQYPQGGSLALALVSSRSGNDQASVAFDQGCGKVSVNGVAIGLGAN